MSKAQAARTFSVSLSSVKRYADKARRGGSLLPKKRPGAAPKLDEKAMKLLEDDLRERPFVSLQERCEYMAARIKDALVEAIAAPLSAISARHVRGFFEHAGYRTTAHLL